MTDGRLPAAAAGQISRAADLARRLPLRWSEAGVERDPDAVLARGFFLGAEECAGVLRTVVPRAPEYGTSFGGRWPFLEVEGWIVAPAIPVAVGHQLVAGCDGEYRRRNDGVWREAVGSERLLLGTDPSNAPPGRPFDLLWFGDGERLLVRDGNLEIEDLFGRLRVPATLGLLERLLCRGLRVDADVLAGLPETECMSAPTVEVRRSAALTKGDRWRDPSAFLNARADIGGAHFDGGRLEGRVESAGTVVFEVEHTEGGWRLTRCGGSYVFTEIRLACHEDELVLTVELDDQIDALASGMRGRLVFDLRADLVALDGIGATQNR